MILSVSRRTDIPSYYSEWFINRLKEGFVYVPNPMNTHALSKVPIHSDVVDCIVFWSKNPQPMLKHLDLLKEYPFYFQFTLNGYDSDIETNLPPKEIIINTFQRLSDRIGPKRMIWRYDPIVVNKKYTVDYHKKAYTRLANVLSGYTQSSIISFLDQYQKIEKNIKDMGMRSPNADEIEEIAASFSQTARACRMSLKTCAEKADLAKYNIEHAKCIDDRLIEQITGCRIKANKDRNQRLECCCVASVDIGMYNTCLSGCLYCYATDGAAFAEKIKANHDVSSPLLLGNVSDSDKITERKATSLKQCQESFLQAISTPTH